ncbi:MAG: PQQ-binding-like beta-propeller repeat protein [Ignavibacteriae bacterium]|nr:PQQ-binding-like beta-propeller repeat protein [Ignavibacteriota bacterium]
MKIFLCCAVVLAVVFHPSVMQSQTISDELWMTDGPVSAMATSGNRLYIGGRFTQVGPPTGQCVALDPISGAMDNTFPRVKGGAVRCIVSDGSGGWFLGGGFRSVGTAPIAHLVHITASKIVDATWNPGVDGDVYAMIVSGSTLFVGGDFTHVGAISRNGLAALNLATGSLLGWNPNADASVFAMQLQGSTLFVGGRFGVIGGLERTRLAAIDISSGSVKPWVANLDNDSFLNPTSVQSITAVGSRIFVGGLFHTIGGQSRNHLAEVDALTADVAPWNPDPSWVVNTMFPDGAVMYVGGLFTSIGGQQRSGLASVDMVSANAMPWDPQLYGESPGWPRGVEVRDLEIIGTSLFVGGWFTQVNNQDRGSLAEFDLTTGALTNWNPNANDYVYMLAFVNSRLFAGGALTSVGGQRRLNLAAIDKASGAVLSWRADANSDIKALLVHDSKLYVGGDFTSLGGQNRSRLALFDAASGVLSNWNPNVDHYVDALAASGSTIFVGGYFTSVNSVNRSRLAAFDAATGALKSWDPNPNYKVNLLAVSGSRVYVAGEFDQIGGQPRQGLAAVDATTGAVLSWDAHLRTYSGQAAWVWAMAVLGSRVYVGGTFNKVGEFHRHNIAAVDAATGALIDWHPDIINYYIFFSIAPTASAIYVGGEFDWIGGQARRNVAALDPVTAQAKPWAPVANDRLGCIFVDGQNVYMGGMFTDVSASSHSHLASSKDPSLPPAIPTLVLNGGFDHGTTSWKQFTPLSNDIVFTTPTGGPSGSFAKLHINRTSNNMQIYQTGFPLIKGKRYRLSFDAYSPTSRQVFAAVRRHTSPYNSYGYWGWIQLTPNWAHYVRDFGAADFSGMTTTDTRLQFYFVYACAPGDDYYFDNVELVQLLSKEGEEEQQTVPTAYALDQNYPNPFNPTTTIRFHIPNDGHVSLKVYDLLGRKVATIVDEVRDAGSYEQVFDSSSLASGMYLYRLQAGSFSNVKKMIILK